MVSIKGQDTEGLAQKYEVHFDAFFMWPSGEMLLHLAQLLNDEIIKPTIDRSYSFEKVQEAYDYLQTGRAKEKEITLILKST